MGDLLKFTLGRDRAGETLYVSGELDIASAPELERIVADATNGQDGDFRVDLSGVPFMDSTGAQTLLQIHNAIQARGRRAVFAALQQPVLRALKVLGLDSVLDIRP